jgi:hypothetical protein
MNDNEPTPPATTDVPSQPRGDGAAIPPSTPNVPAAAQDGAAPITEAQAQVNADSGAKTAEASMRIDEIHISGGDLKNSPIGAATVNYYGANLEDASAKIDPTYATRLADFGPPASLPETEVALLRTRLLATRTLFILFEQDHPAQFEALRNALLQAMGDADYNFRTTRRTKPLDFELLRQKPSLFKYAKTTVLALSSNTIGKNIDFLEQDELMGGLRDHAAALNVYLIVPVPRSEIPNEFERVRNKPADHIWLIDASGSSAQDAGILPVKLDHDNLLGKTAQFVTVFLRGLTQTEFNATIEALLANQPQGQDDMLAWQSKKDRQTAPPPDLLTQWTHSKDSILLACGIVYQRNDEGQGGFGFANPQNDTLLPRLFLESARGWVAQQFDTLLDILFTTAVLPDAMQRSIMGLLLQLHEYQIIAINAGWIADLFERRVKEAGSGGPAFSRFERLLHHLLRSPHCKEQAMSFLKSVARQCQTAANSWLTTLFALDAMGQDMQRVVQALSTEQRAPLEHVNQMQALIVGAMRVEAIANIVPLILIAVQETDQHYHQARPFAKNEVLRGICRPAAWGMLFWLTNYFKHRSYDAMIGFGHAVLDANDTVDDIAGDTGGDETDSARQRGLTILLDALHVAVFAAAEQFVEKQDEHAKQFLDYYFAAVETSDFAAVLARSNLLRSPPRELSLLPDNPVLQANDLAATMRFYEGIVTALHQIEGGKTAGLRLRTKALIKPLAKALSFRQRSDFRQILRNAEAYYRELKTKREQLQNRTGARKILQNIDVINVMMAALP